MKGLILKELYILKGYGKQYGFIFTFLFVWSVAIKSFSFLIVYFVLIGSQIVMSTVTADEAVSFNRFALTMPVDRKMIIKSKYALFLGTVGGGALLGGVLNLLLNLMGKEGAYEWEGFGAIVSVFVVANAIAIPIMFKSGVEKARYAVFIIMFLMAGLIVAGAQLGEKTGISISQLEEYGEGVLNIFCMAVAALSLVISYFVSIKVTKNKEW